MILVAVMSQLIPSFQLNIRNWWIKRGFLVLLWCVFCHIIVLLRH